MRVILSRHISPEQHGLLHDKQIHDVVSNSQECMHLIHIKHLNAAILQVDLQKAYDCVDWAYLKMVLSKIGIQPRCVDWIMECVINVNFSVITDTKHNSSGLYEDFDMVAHSLHFYSFWHWMV